MRQIGHISLPKRLREHLNDDLTKVAHFPAFKVANFDELIKIMAEVAFKNRDQLLFYRGQSTDYQNKGGASTFYPTIYRGHLSPSELKRRFNVLDKACIEIKKIFQENKLDGYTDVRKRRYVQWSIIQHYEICETPLLDFTHSLRVACSFAMLNNNTNKAFVYVFGLPYITNRISHNSEHDIVNIRLLSICPPIALRPYFQEGYLAGTDEVMDDYERKDDLDFNRRLIAKFEIPNNSKFFTPAFKPIPRGSLSPENDVIADISRNIKKKLIGEPYEYIKIY